MVSRETLLPIHTLSADFIAGFVSASGTFLYIHTPRVEQFGFQIKVPSKNRRLLEMVRLTLRLKNQIHIYKEGGTEYALLITRSKKELLAKVVPMLEDRLFGLKMLQFQRWKTKLEQNL